jgi:fervidolysin-like protein
VITISFSNESWRGNWHLIALLFAASVVAIALPISRASLSDSDSASGKQLTVFSTRTKQEKPEFVLGEILVRFRSDATAIKAGARSEIVVAEGSRQVPIHLERLAEGDELVEGLRLARVAPEDTDNAIAALRSRPDVIYAEPNFIRHKEAVPNDPRYADQWALKNTGQFGPPAGVDIKAEEAWDVTTGSRSIVVGVVDEGIDITIRI